MRLPLVSILIPVFNRETMIGECIEAALRQTVTDTEVIIVDNASTDNTWDICKEYAAKDSRVRIFQNKKNIGPVKNWKRCIDEAQGIYGKILFSDDGLAPDFLEKTLPWLQNPEVGFVFTQVLIGEKLGLGNVYYNIDMVSREFSSKNYIDMSLFGNQTPLSPGCSLFRLDDLKKNLQINIPSPSIKDFQKHGAGPDLLLYLLTANDYKKIAYVCEPSVFFRSHKESITVGSNSIYLSRCYNQARLWFAQHYLSKEIFWRLCARTWIRTCRGRKKMLPADDVLNEFFEEKVILPEYIRLREISEQMLSS